MEYSYEYEYTFVESIRNVITQFAIGTATSLHVHVPRTTKDVMLWNKLAGNPRVPTQFIWDNMDKPWNFAILSGNPNVTLELISKFPDVGWDCGHMSANPNITWDYIMKTDSHKSSWNMMTLSTNPVITVDIVLDNPLFGWDMKRFSANPNVTKYIIMNHPELHWDMWFFVFRNPNATWEDIVAFDHCMENELEVNRSKCVTPVVVRANPAYPWNPRYLVYNSNFDLAALLAIFPSLAISNFLSYMGSNPNVTVDQILAIHWGLLETAVCSKASCYIHWRDIRKTRSTIKWEWCQVLGNSTIFDCNDEIEQAKAARVILNGWRESLSNPRYKLCKHRLANEFAELDALSLLS
jgi:hypothetical protein